MGKHQADRDGEEPAARQLQRYQIFISAKISTSK